jgi:ankyrin repeat protein
MERSFFLSFLLLTSLSIPYIAAQEVEDLQNAQKSLKSSIDSFLRCFKKNQPCSKQQRNIIKTSLTIIGALGVIATGGAIVYFAKRGAQLPKEAIRAAAYGNLEDLKQSLPTKPTASYLNQVTDNGDTLLHLAARNGHHQIVQWLLDNGAIPTTNKAGNTPLSTAMTFQNVFPHKKDDFSRTIDILTEYASPGLQPSSKK